MSTRLLIPFTALFVFAGIYFSSCRKTPSVDPARQFATSGGISVKAGPTSAVLSWKEAVNTDSTKSTYTVQISLDSSFTTGTVLTFVTSGTSLTVTDTQLTVRLKYYARVKTNGATPDLDSRWIRSSGFSLTGEQIFLPVKEVEIRFNSVILRWKDTTRSTLVKIVLTPNGGAPIDFPLTQQDMDSSYKKIDGLTPNTKYHAQILSTTKEKGYLDFTTKDQPVYSFTVNPTMDLSLVLDTCSPSIIIGLDSGTYNTTTTYTLKSKSVTLVSTSGNPLDTRVIFKEFKMVGDGAGINLRDLTFDGLSTANYFLNFGGLASDAAPANFANISLQNCRVLNYTNCLMRANRGTAAGDHKIGSVTINNCVFYNNTLLNLYTEFTFDKLAFQNLTITNSTFNKVGRALILMSTTLPASAPVPIVVFDHNTVNNFGTGATVRAIMDANTNPVQATFTNSIFANTPRTSTLYPDMIRATGTGTAVTFSYNDYFRLTTGAAAPLTMPANIVQVANQQIDLGWDSTTVNFTLPATSPLRGAGSNGGPIGDPRWN